MVRGVAARLQRRVRNSRLAASLDAQRWRPLTFAACLDGARQQIAVAKPADRMSSRRAAINHPGGCWDLFSRHDSTSRWIPIAFLRVSTVCAEYRGNNHLRVNGVFPARACSALSTCGRSP